MQKPVVEVDTTISASGDKVWKAMTAHNSAMFPGTQVETDWKIGHPITFTGEWQGKPFIDKGEIQTFKEGEELSFTHWSAGSGEAQRPEDYHIVRCRLEPEGDKTKVTLSQINMGKKTDIGETRRAEFKKNWQMMLDGLKQAAESD